MHINNILINDGFEVGFAPVPSLHTGDELELYP